MKLSMLAETLEASFLCGADRLDIEIDKAGASDLMSDILAALSERGVLLTGLGALEAVAAAEEGKDVILVGMDFSRKERNLVGFAFEPV